MPDASALSIPAALLTAVAGAAWAVRGRSSSVFAPSVWRGPQTAKRIALTFDDGPVPATLPILELLSKHGAPATFFQIGALAERYPAIAREVVLAGHEIGNHSYSHSNFALKSADFITDDFTRAQRAIEDAGHVRPVWCRAPYGVRWFGFGPMQFALGLTGVMWTVIGRDWKLPAADIAGRVISQVTPGGIVCLHDGRGASPEPDSSPTLEALRTILPRLIDAGYHFVTISDLLCLPN